MMDLDNSRKSLIAEVVVLLRNEIDEWPSVSGSDFSDVGNVWPKNVPDEVKNQFPRASVDVVAEDDTELDVEGNKCLKEVVLKVTVFGEEDGKVEDLMDASEDSIKGSWESYGTDWHFRERDGTTPKTENEGGKGKLRYNRSMNFVFECVKQNG